jgi:hypothetical protein
MELNLEFVCFDARPLKIKRKKRDGLLDYLELLHTDNGAIKTTIDENQNKDKAFYRNVGMLTQTSSETKKQPIFFNTRHSIKFPDFVTHKVGFKSHNQQYYIDRDNNPIYRYFKTSDYGMINWYELRFTFNVKDSKDDKKVLAPNSFDLLSFIFGRKNEKKDDKKENDYLTIRIKKKETTLWRLGAEWLPKIISDSTRKMKPKNECKSDEDVRSVAMTAIITYEKKELDKFPWHITDFNTKNCPFDIKVRYFDFKSKERLDDIRVYFIEKSKNCTNNLKVLKSYIFKLRRSYACLGFALLERNEYTDHDIYKNLVKAIMNIYRDKNYEFLKNEPRDDKIYDPDAREKLKEILTEHSIT